MKIHEVYSDRAVMVKDLNPGDVVMEGSGRICLVTDDKRSGGKILINLRTGNTHFRTDKSFCYSRAGYIAGNRKKKEKRPLGTLVAGDIFSSEKEDYIVSSGAGYSYPAHRTLILVYSLETGIQSSFHKNDMVTIPDIHLEVMISDNRSTRQAVS